MNRYSNYSVGQMDPLSLDEIMTAPLYKEQQYNKLQDSREKLAETFKIDPRAKYIDEAQRLNSEFNSKILDLSTYQAKTGDIKGTEDKFRQLNKEYRELTNPLGKVSQINKDKINVEAAREKYIKGATTLGYSPEAVQSNFEKQLSKHDSENPLYDNIGMVKEFSTNLPGNRVDVIEEAKKLYASTGVSQTDVSNAVEQFKEAVDSGVSYTEATSHATSRIKNTNQRNAVIDYIHNVLFDPNSDGRKTEEYEGRDFNTTLKRVKDLSGVYAKNSTDTKNTQNISNVQRPSGDDEDANDKDPDYEGVNVEGTSITKNSDLLENMNNMNKKDNVSFSNALANSTTGLRGSNGKYIPNKTVSTKQDEVLNSQEYLQLARSINRTQKLGAKSLKDLKVQTAVKKYLAENKDVTVENRFVDPNVKGVGNLFASKEVTKDKNASSNLIMERAQQGNIEIRDVEGNVIPTDELGKFKFTYSGDMTAKSVIENKKGKPIFLKSKQNIGARRGLLYDPETKKSIRVYASRSDDDFDTPQWKGMNIINGITKLTDSRPGIYHRISVPEFKQMGVTNFEVKYNKGSDTYNVSYTDSDGTAVDERPMSDPQFQEYILNTQLQ